MSTVLPSLADPAETLSRVRADSPLVQCITNTVVSGFTANVLLALGAAPAMVDIPEEAGLFAGIAGASLINLGTPTAEQRQAALETSETSQRWVLDPVAVGVLPVRTHLAAALIGRGPAIVRGNASEILAVSGAGAGGRGVDSTASTTSARDAAVALSLSSGAVVAVSGPVDLISDGERIVHVRSGDPLLTRVTGGGCALGAVMAAFLAVTDPLSAAVSASLVYGRAAELAAAIATGPGSFAVSLIDALAAVQPADLDASARLSDEDVRPGISA